MIESAWLKNIGHFLYHLDPDARKTKRLECLHLKSIKKKYSGVFNIDR